MNDQQLVKQLMVILTIITQEFCIMFAPQIRPPFGRRVTPGILPQEAKIDKIIDIKFDVEALLQSMSSACEDHFGFSPDEFIETSKFSRLKQAHELLRQAQALIASL